MTYNKLFATISLLVLSTFATACGTNALQQQSLNIPAHSTSSSLWINPNIPPAKSDSSFEARNKSCGFTFQQEAYKALGTFPTQEEAEQALNDHLASTPCDNNCDEVVHTELEYTCSTNRIAKVASN